MRVEGPADTDALLAARGGLGVHYRGSLEFLQQARAQQRGRELVVEVGWRYFVHGWSQVVADVFAVPMPRETAQELAASP